jgi:hypothetical protein
MESCPVSQDLKATTLGWTSKFRILNSQGILTGTVTKLYAWTQLIVGATSELPTIRLDLEKRAEAAVKEPIVHNRKLQKTMQQKRIDGVK